MRLPSFSEGHLEALCGVLGDTTSGLTGSEIDSLLRRLGIADERPTDTKRIRLFHALALRQGKDACGNQVIAFIQEAMRPVRYHSTADVFEERRAALNVVLAFSGYTIRADGVVVEMTAATTLPEAESRARALETKLRDRGVHTDVLRFCQAELVVDNYFHAVLEATKSVADKLRERSNSTLDGAPLVDFALGGNAPRLAINSLQTETQRSEQAGLVNMLKGMFGTFRNVTGHAPKIKWPIDEQDAMDLLSLASYLHRRIDGAVQTGYDVRESA